MGEEEYPSSRTEACWNKPKKLHPYLLKDFFKVTRPCTFCSSVSVLLVRSWQKTLSVYRRKRRTSTDRNLKEVRDTVEW
jgi:hypothetical protein